MKVIRNSVEEYKDWIRKEIKKNPHISHWEIIKKVDDDWKNTLMVMQAIKEITDSQEPLEIHES